MLNWGIWSWLYWKLQSVWPKPVWNAWSAGRGADRLVFVCLTNWYTISHMLRFKTTLKWLSVCSLLWPYHGLLSQEQMLRLALTAAIQLLPILHRNSESFLRAVISSPNCRPNTTYWRGRSVKVESRTLHWPFSSAVLFLTCCRSVALDLYIFCHGPVPFSLAPAKVMMG